MTSLKDLLGRVPSLNTDSAWVHAVVGETIVVSNETDNEYSLRVELDEVTKTFLFVETKPAAASGPRRFEAGGVFNAAKRAGLRGHMPQRRRVKEQLVAFLGRGGWKRAR